MAKLQLLVPMDGTEFSRAIEPQIRKLFPPENWALRLLHVARVPVDPGAAAYEPATVGPDYRLYMYGYEMPGATTLHPMYDEDRLEDFRLMLENDLQNEVRQFENQGYEVSAAVHFGEPASAIVGYAEETGVDLVAMATHHRKGLDRLLHGSVARRALNHLSIPALLLRVDDDETTQEQSELADERTLEPAAPVYTAPELADDRIARPVDVFDRAPELAEPGQSDLNAHASSGYVAGGSSGQMRAERSPDPDAKRSERSERRDPGAKSERSERRDPGAKSERSERRDPGARMPRAATKGSTDVHKDDYMVTPAETSPATLAGMPGRGVLTILFGDEDEQIGTQGSWFPDDPEADLTPLEQAARNSRSVIFEGRSVAAETAGHDDLTGEKVRRAVSVTSVRRYRDYGGEVHNLVSFELLGEPDMTDVPDQYTREEFEALSLSKMADLTGLELPRDLNPEEEAKFRAKAWDSYRLDIENRDEWGTARQNTALPQGE